MGGIGDGVGVSRGLEVADVLEGQVLVGAGDIVLKKGVHW